MTANQDSKRDAPAWTDTVHARKLAALLEADPDLSSWLDDKLGTERGGTELRALLWAARAARREASGR